MLEVFHRLLRDIGPIRERWVMWFNKIATYQITDPGPDYCPRAQGMAAVYAAGRRPV